MSLVRSNRNGNIFPFGFSDFFNADNFFNNRWFEKEYGQSLPAVNIKENEKQYSLEFAAPGFGKEDFKINVENNVVIVSAEKKEEKNEENEKFTRKEFAYNSFTRSFTLPENVKAENMDAKYADGILKLSIPKKEEVKGHARKEIKVA